MWEPFECVFYWVTLFWDSFKGKPNKNPAILGERAHLYLESRSLSIEPRCHYSSVLRHMFLFLQTFINPHGGSLGHWNSLLALKNAKRRSDGKLFFQTKKENMDGTGPVCCWIAGNEGMSPMSIPRTIPCVLSGIPCRFIPQNPLLIPPMEPAGCVLLPYGCASKICSQNAALLSGNKD